MQIQIKRVRPGAKLPTYGSEMAAGMDLYAHIDGPVLICPQEKAFLIPTGIAIHIADPNYVAMVYPRSGLGHKYGLVLGNGTGVIDADFQGEMFVSAWNRNPSRMMPSGIAEAITVMPGDRIAQMVFMPIVRAKFEVVEEFSAASGRGAGGWGSTGGAGALEKAVVAAGVDSRPQTPRHGGYALMIGISGAHGAGKTTTALKFSELHNVPFVPSPARKAIGGATTSITTMRDRLRVQNAILDAATKSYMSTRSSCLIRTPLDFAAYTLADVRQEMQPDEIAGVMDFVYRCVWVTNQTFNHVVIMQPGIPYASEPGRPPANTAYQEMFANLVMGLVEDERLLVNYYVIPRPVTALGERVEILKDIWQGCLSEFAQVKKEVRFH